MRKRQGVLGTVISLISTLTLLGLFLAVLSQFGWDFGALLKWILDAAWSFVTMIKDTIAGWPTFQRLF